MTNKHPRYDLIMQVAADTTLDVWVWSPMWDAWIKSSIFSIVNEPKRIFVLGPKPTEPPPQPGVCRMLTDEEIVKGLVDAFNKRLRQNPNEILQRKFCEINNLTLKAPT